MADPSLHNSTLATPPARAVSGTLALAGFTIAVLSGLMAGNPAEVILVRAAISMFGCLLIGSIIGRFCEVAVTEYLFEYKRSHPVPDSSIEVEDLALEMHRERQSVRNQEAGNKSDQPDENND